MKAPFPVVGILLLRTTLKKSEIDNWLAYRKDKVDTVPIQEYLRLVLNHSRDNLKADKSQRKVPDHNSLTCRQPFERLIVKGKGSVLPGCFHFATKMVIGNILNQTLREIRLADKIRELRKMSNESLWQNHPRCSKCSSLYYELTLGCDSDQPSLN